MPVLVEGPALVAPTPAVIRHQLTRLSGSEHLRHSRRSVAFLRYIVEETLLGRADEIKERTIGVNVFGKALTYDTNGDHVVRTAASELRRRLTLYYGEEQHRAELRIVLLPGSYVPQFRLAEAPEKDEAGSAQSVSHTTPEPLLQPDASASLRPSSMREVRTQEPAPRSPDRRHSWSRWVGCGVAVALLALAGLLLRPVPTPAQRFWQPLLRSHGSVLIAAGDVPQGPPVPTPDGTDTPAPNPAGSSEPAVPFGDTTAIARVAGVLASAGKDYVIRREDVSSFADLRQGPVVLVGAFNNVWSLRLSRDLRFSLAMDPVQRVLYIRDRQHPNSRAWQWSVAPHPEEKERTGNQTLHDYALISRILDSETGHEVVIIGGLYAYGTAAAGEFISNPQMTSLPREIQLGPGQRRVQIVLETEVTDGTAGPPRVVATSVE
jgi:hypothetical protein